MSIQKSKQTNQDSNPKALVPDWLLNIYKEVGFIAVNIRQTDLQDNTGEV